MKIATLNIVLRFLLLFALSVTSGISLSAKRVVESGDNSPGFSYSADSGASEPIIRYQLNVEMLANIPDRQTISIFGDGRVVVHNPDYMKKSGDFEMWLTAKELDQLVTDLSNDGLMDFDHEKAQGRVKAAMKAMRDKGRFYAISDDVETVIDIRLEEFQKDKKSKKIKNFNKQFRWKNLPQEAARFSNDTALVRANHAADRLAAMKKDSRLVRTGRP